MSARDIAPADFEVVDETPFFAPMASDLLDGLLGQYQRARARIAEVATFINGELHEGVIHYFLEGNRSEDRGRVSLSRSASQLFEEEGAVKALNSAYWSKALALTDVLDAMPQKRRDEWHKTITEMSAPEFTEDTVRVTITELLNMRQQFLAERVDGIFRGLSGEHVTNAPEAFGKRMIVSGVLSSYGYSNYSTCGLINDLRCVVAKFMGRDEPGYGHTEPLIRHLKNSWGEWVSIDGGALRIRLYKKGTAHLEVHPDMAWRLNCVLAHLYPLIIPASFRAKPKKKLRDFQLMNRPLPFAVLTLLERMRVPTELIDGGWPERHRKIPNALQFDFSDSEKPARREAERILMTLGGVPVVRNAFWTYYQFDYPVGPVIAEIVTSGCVPDQQSHQFYPTPEPVARAAVELADIGLGHSVLEPSAGHGDLAAFLPIERTTCVEVSALRCSVLQARGFDVVQADFIEMAKTSKKFDRIVMNPPFSDGRWQAHVEAAASLLMDGGRLVAVVPSSARNKYTLPGLECAWSRVYDNEFAGTSVSVVILCATRGAA